MTWDRISNTGDLAMIGVAGTSGSKEFFESGDVTARTIKDAISVDPFDTVLEIGCGVGRIGKALAPHCKKWIGCDISAQMLKHAKSVLSDHSNVELIELNSCSLHSIDSASVDKVYCSAVFMHLDEWDRYQYVQEAYRVLQVGGRCYFDNINLGGEIGWQIFMQMKQHDERLRPPNISKSSTPEELAIYLNKAGFAEVEIFPGAHFVAATGKKLS